MLSLCMLCSGNFIVVLWYCQPSSVLRHVFLFSCQAQLEQKSGDSRIHVLNFFPSIIFYYLCSLSSQGITLKSLKLFTFATDWESLSSVLQNIRFLEIYHSTSLSKCQFFSKVSIFCSLLSLYDAHELVFLEDVFYTINVPRLLCLCKALFIYYLLHTLNTRSNLCCMEKNYLIYDWSY